MTPGESNVLVAFFACLICIPIFQITRAIFSDIRTVKALFPSTTERPNYIYLREMSTLTWDLKQLEVKHFYEFSSIFAVSEVPKIRLKRKNVVSEFQIRVRADGSRQAVASIEPFSEDMLVFKDVPMCALADLFGTALGDSYTVSDVMRRWVRLLREVVVPCTGLKHSCDDSYRLVDDRGIRTPITNIQRIERALSKFSYRPSSSETLLDLNRSDFYPSLHVPLVVVTVPRAQILDQMCKMSLMYTSESDSILTLSGFFDPFESTQPSLPITLLAELDSIYGFEENPAPECMICCESIVNTLLIDCCHASTCENCTNSFRDGKCPICRNSVKEKIIIPVRRPDHSRSQQ